MGKCFSLTRVILLFGILLIWHTQVDEAAHIFGVSCTDNDHSYSSEGWLKLYLQSNFTIRLFGVNLTTPGAQIQLTSSQSDCSASALSQAFELSVDSDTSGTVFVNLDNNPTQNGDPLYICYRDESTMFEHQGNATWLTLVFEDKLDDEGPLLPLPLQIIVLVVLLCMSGLFSGLNLGLMSLDPMELKIVEKSGSKDEQKFAKKIYPVRAKGNFLLCTLLLGNVLVNNTLTILLNDLVSGLMAVIGSTAGIVVFGEIVPQAICSRYGLQVGAYTLWLTKIFMVVTFLASWPISKILDLVLGEEIGNVYNRKKLLEMLKVTDPYNDLEKDEVNIIQGALELSSKTVEDVMTPLEDCYMIDINATLDFDTMREIMSTGYTRIPVYEKERDNVCWILFVKDLAFVDPDDCMSLRTVCDFYQHTLHFVFNDITLDKLLEQFKTGTFHMAIVHRVNSEGDGDPFYETIGIITMEDVIEEIIKSEIVDETDKYTDNKTKQPNSKRQAFPVDLSLFAQKPDHQQISKITPQQTLATLRFLRAEVEPFKNVSEKVLLRLLKHDVIITLNHKDVERHSDKFAIYKRNKLADYFVLIIEGEVKVQVGKENLEFMSGPFSYYGVTVLKAALTASNCNTPQIQARNNSSDKTDELNAISNAVQNATHNSISALFQPDYTLYAMGDCKYLKITRKQFINALRTTQMSETVGHELESGRNSPVAQQRIFKMKLEDDSVHTLTNNHHAAAVSSSNDSIHNYSSRSHSDITPPHHPLKQIKDQSKCISSDQLRALAASYANVVGDRVRPNAILKTLARSGSLQPTTDRSSRGRLLTSSRESVSTKGLTVMTDDSATLSGGSSTHLDVSTSTVTSSSPVTSRVDITTSTTALSDDDESKKLLSSSKV